jgi:phospholipid/cholesterol/gamma-HCH transport system substrate-binding protein
MVTKAQKIRLGIFIAIGSVLILVFAGVVAGSKLFQKRDIYYVQYSDVSVNGLQVGGTVNYHGIKVGRVETIKLNPKDVSKVILTISVEAGTPIKADVEATLVPVGITGLKSVELRGGSNQAVLVKPNSYLRTGTSTFDDITGRAVSIAEKIDLIASNISSITNNENQKNIAEILRQTSLLLSDTRENLGGTLKSLSVIAANASEITSSASSNLTKFTDNANANMTLLTTSTVSNIDKISNSATGQMESMGKNLNQSITELNANTNLLLTDTRTQINTVGNRSDQMIIQTTKNIGDIAANINLTLNRINQIVNTAPFDSLIINANTISRKLAAADLVQLVSDLNVTVNKTSSMIANVDRTVSRGRTDLLQTLEDLREAAENLNEFSKQISEDPSVLLKGTK